VLACECDDHLDLVFGAGPEDGVGDPARRPARPQREHVLLGLSVAVAHTVLEVGADTRGAAAVWHWHGLKQLADCCPACFVAIVAIVIIVIAVLLQAPRQRRY
jgi:hypothetical protein